VTDAPKPPEPESGVPAQPMPPPPPVPQARQPATGEIGAEPAPGAGEQAPGAGEQAPAPRSRGRTLRIVLASVLGGLAVLCVGGLGTGYLLYRKVSEPDRSTPGVVVRQYLEAIYDDRDQLKAERFTCGRPADIRETQQELADLVSREKRFDIRITVGWENFTTQANKTSATVGVRLKIAVPEENGQPSESFQQWTFSLRHQSSGWRVCDAHRVG
jgi:hypothetical protein